MNLRDEQRHLHAGSLTKRALQGAGIALVLIALFLISAGQGNPEWPKYWQVRPLLVVPLAGAVGGMIYYYFDYLRIEGGWKRFGADVMSLLIYFIGLWLGFVLGLDGTMWN